MSLGEVRYALFAQQATARIVQQSSYDITYAFDDNGTARKETVMLNLENQRVAGTSVTVTYIPGSIGSSRLADQSRMGWVYFMLGCFVVLSFFGWRFWRYYKS